MNLSVPMFSSHITDRGLDYLSPINRVLNSHRYILGNEVSEFEKEFSSYCGVSNCIGVANGTDALEIGLRACGIVVGDEVCLVANAGFYGSTAINLLGAVPLYVDVDPETMTMSVDNLKEKICDSKPKVIIVTHLYGQLAKIEEIVKIADEKGILVIEDCAQSHGARHNGKVAGSFGAIGCFSFYPTKNLGALGDGGAVVTTNTQLAEKVQQLHQYGWSNKYHVEVIGGRNSRLDEIQAAILRTKLPYLDTWNEQRRDIATKYNKAFKELPLICPSSLGHDYVAHLYVVRLNERELFQKYLAERGVSSDVHYPIADHLQQTNKSSVTDCISLLPVTENICETVVSLPCFPGLSGNAVDYVISVVQSYFNEEME